MCVQAIHFLFIVGGFLIASVAWGKNANPFPTAELDRIAREFDGRLGVYMKDLREGVIYGFQEDQRFPSASAIKLPIMIALYREAAAGRIDLASKSEMPADISRHGTGSLSGQEGRITLSIREYCRLMMTQSDNMATDQVIRILGLPTINGFLEDQGFRGTRLAMEIGRWHYLLVGMDRDPVNPVNDRKFDERMRAKHFVDSGPGYSASLDNNVICPIEMGVLLEKLHRGELADAAATAEMLGLMTESGPGRIGKYLRADVRVAKKHGSSRRIGTDAGLIYLKHGPLVFVACVLEKDAASSRGRELISHFAKLACEALEPGSTIDPPASNP